MTTATCKKPVGRGIVNFPCDLSTDHDGPCRAVEVSTSIHARQVWEAQRTSAATLRQFQSEPYSTGVKDGAPAPAPHPEDRLECPACDHPFFRVEQIDLVHYCPFCGSSFKINDHGMEVLLEESPVARSRRAASAPPQEEPEQEEPEQTLASHVESDAKPRTEVVEVQAEALTAVEDALESFLSGGAPRSVLHDALEAVRSCRT